MFTIVISSSFPLEVRRNFWVLSLLCAWHLEPGALLQVTYGAASFATATASTTLACDHPAWQSPYAFDFFFNLKKSLFLLGILPQRSEERTHCRFEYLCLFFLDPGPEGIDYFPFSSWRGISLYV